MLNEVVKGLKRTKTDWLSPNLSEPVRAVRTAEELAHIEGHLANIPQQELSVSIDAKGVFSIPKDIPKQTRGYAGNLIHDVNDVIRFSVGNDKPHNNMPLSIASYAWRRQA